MPQRQAFIVRVEPNGDHVTVEDVRAARAARVDGLADVGGQIERWLAPHPDDVSAIAPPHAVDGNGP